MEPTAPSVRAITADKARPCTRPALPSRTSWPRESPLASSEATVHIPNALFQTLR